MPDEYSEAFRINNPQRSISFFERMHNYIVQQVRDGYLFDISFVLLLAVIVYGIYSLIRYGLPYLYILVVESLANKDTPPPAPAPAQPPAPAPPPAQPPASPPPPPDDKNK